MDRFEEQLKSLKLRTPSESFGQEQTLAALLEADRAESTWRRKKNRLAWKTTAAALLGIAAAVLVTYILLSASTGNSVALAQVAAKVEGATTLSFVQTKEPMDGGPPKEIYRFTSIGTDKTRSDSQSSDPEHEMTTIYDYAAGKQLYLYPSKKEALITTIKGRPTPDENLVNQMLNSLLKDMKDIKRPYRSLGHKLIDGVDCIGYEFGHGDQKSRSWADAKTGKLVRSEIDNFLEPPFSSLQGIYRLVWSNFKIDEKVDPALFSLEPPEGYRVIQNPWVYDFSKTPAQLATTVLRIYAENMDGQFPAKLADEGLSIYDDFKKKGLMDQKEWEVYGAKNSEMSNTIWQLNNFFLSFERGTEHENYEYYPGGKLGEKDRIVFWCKAQDGGYKAVYGDLRIEPIEESQLPKSGQKSQK